VRRSEESLALNDVRDAVTLATHGVGTLFVEKSIGEEWTHASFFFSFQ
jgi:hypothetical protein